MKAVALVLGICLLGLVVPVTVEAHVVVCRADDAKCIVLCVAGHYVTPPPHACVIDLAP